jgi:hypothetical protein
MEPILYSETDVITIPELARRLKVDKGKAYDMTFQPDCPVYDLGGERGKRVIWGDFLGWFRNKYRIASGG